MTTTNDADCEARRLMDAVAAAPMDWLARLALADALEEGDRGMAARLERAAARCVRAGEVEWVQMSEAGRAYVYAVERHYLYAGKPALLGVFVTDGEAPQRHGGGLAKRYHYGLRYERAAHDAGVPPLPAPGRVLSQRWWSEHENGWLLALYVHPADLVYFLAEGGA